MSRTLLLDADLLAYRASAALQETIDWNGDGSCVTVEGHLKEAKRAVRMAVDEAMDELKAQDLVICLSDEVVNFRKEIEPTYKANRAGSERPVHLYDLKDWLAETYETAAMPRLEADDVMGIMATEPYSGDRIMVSQDKDMGTVPALWCRNLKNDWSVREVSVEEAERFHLWQTLTGDTTDGYVGCPGCGPKAAEAILDDGLMWHRTDREITRGKRKGEVETKWALGEGVPYNAWGRLLSAYHKAGLREVDALKQARLAFILRHGSLDGQRIRLWTPPI